MHLNPLARNGLDRRSAPPAAHVRTPTAPADTFEKAQPDAPEAAEPRSLWQKAVLLGTLAATAASGLGGCALMPGLPATSLGTLTDAPSRGPRLGATVVPEDAPRIDLVRNHEWLGLHDAPYSPVGLHLGDGLLQDTNGNLVLIPSLTYGWGLEASQFTHVDLAKGEASVSRFGPTVQFQESSTSRHVIFERGGSAEIMGPRGHLAVTRDSSGNLQAKDADERLYEILKTPDGYRILPGGDGAVAVEMLGPSGLRVSRAGRTVGAVEVGPDAMRITGPDGEVRMTRTEGGHLVEIDGPSDHRLSRDGRLILGDDDSKRVEVDPPAAMRETGARYQALLEHLESVEPGWAKKHPVVAAVLEYAAANPALLTRQDNPGGLLEAGTALATAGATLESGTALMAGSTAMTLAEGARALGAAALSAKAAAQSAAQAGNLTQAASLANEARSMAAQAREMGQKAMETGKGAKNMAQVARIAMGVAGALEIVDGGFDVYDGARDRSLVDGAIAVTQAQVADLEASLSGPEFQTAMEDYSKVMRVLDHLQEEADKDVQVGGLKIGFGSLMLISALLGPEAPMALGVVGIVGTAGTAIYENWDDIHAFLTGTTEEVPRFIDLIPDSDRVRIDLGSEGSAP